jgi:predicted dehydrogenase
MGTSPVNIALIGFGRIAELVHLRTLMALPDVVVGAVAESDAQRLKRLWERAPHAGTFTDYHALLRDSEAEAVVICLPPAQHGAAAIAAFEAGKHIYLEKPITPSLAEADAVRAAWRASGRLGMMGFNFRYHPLYVQMRAIIASGQYGAVIAASSVFSTPTRQLPAWKEQRQTGGGVLLDLASHHIDLVRYLFAAPIACVSAFEHTLYAEADNATLHLRLESGVLVQSMFSMNSISQHRFEVSLEKARLVADLAQPEALEVCEGTTYLTRGQRMARALRSLSPRHFLRAPGYEPSFARALGVFAQAVRAGGDVSPDLDDGYRCLQVVEAAETAARTRTQVALAAPTPEASPAS